MDGVADYASAAVEGEAQKSPKNSAKNWLIFIVLECLIFVEGKTCLKRSRCQNTD